jgi:hypothetical protein
VKYTLKLGKALQNSSKITSQNDLSEHQKSSIRLPRFVPSWFLFHGMVRNGIPRDYLYYLLHGKEYRVVFSSVEWFGTKFREFASILVSRNGIPSCVLFRRRVRNRIMGVCFYCFSTEQNSELFSLPRKGSERNSEIFCSAEQPEFRRK